MKDFITSNGKTVAILQQHFPTENTMSICQVERVKSPKGRDVHILGNFVIYECGYKSDYVCSGNYRDVFEYAMSL